MSPILVLIASVGFVHSFPAIPTYNQDNAAFAYYNPWQYNRANPYSFQEEGKKYWNNLVNQRNAIQSQAPGFQGSWTWIGSGPPNDAFRTAVQSSANALSGTNSNLGIQRTQTSYNQQASQGTSRTNTNRGFNSHQGTNYHQGSNVGPSNYNGPQSGSSSTVNAPHKQPVLVQGARSSAGDSGSIYVPGY